jgi:hypothetical protein
MAGQALPDVKQRCRVLPFRHIASFAPNGRFADGCCLVALIHVAARAVGGDGNRPAECGRIAIRPYDIRLNPVRLAAKLEPSINLTVALFPLMC